MNSDQVEHNYLLEITMQQSSLVKTENGFTFRDPTKTVSWMREQPGNRNGRLAR